MPKITLDQLNALVANPGQDEAALSEYFILDEDASSPFAPRFKLNPETVEIPKGDEGVYRSAAAMNGANWFSRLRRKGKFYRKLSDGYTGPIIVSEGDSWWQYPILLHDTIDKLMETYAIFSLGAAGDLLENMANKQEYMHALRETGASILLMSGGGNDLVAGGALADYLEAFDVDLLPGDYLKPEFQGLLDNAFGQYERMFRQVRGAFPHVHILCHGYDYPVPARGRWLGRPMETRGINDRSLQKKIAAEMMNRFNRGLRRLANAMPHVTYIDCRNTVGDGRWHDELHPNNAGYADVAALFDRKIRELANLRSGPVLPIDGPFGRNMSAPETVGRASKAMSLHLGINVVDPAHYAGWDGKLNACENDANALSRLARKQGFEPQVLLSENATRARVVEEVTRAAETLDEGDMFFWSVSSHGGQMPDLNNDEVNDSEDQPKDETLLLYDFQMADDEIYHLWSLFKPGVRILMMPDTCHSGTMLRANPFELMMLGEPMPDPLVRPRQMPPDIARQTFTRNEAEYRDYQRSFSAIKESLIVNPLTTPVKASVLSISACQDHQLANDGAEFGAFTGAALRVWDNGRFTGNYEQFHREVTRAINNPSQQPKLSRTGADDPGFARQVPFTLWTNPQATVLGAPVMPVAPMPAPTPVSAQGGGSPADFLTGTEGDETDTLPDDMVAAIVDGKARGDLPEATRSARGWADAADFAAFIDALNLRHFSAQEFLILGGSHVSPGSAGFGKNTFPPRSLWPNIANTARVIDELRARLDRPVVITNAYRAPAYNSAIGGARASQHLKFTAIDFKVPGLSTSDYAWALRRMRDTEDFFSGGIGLYNSFVHVDTRGVDATWPPAFKNGTRSGAPAIASNPAAMPVAERRARIDAIDLPKTRGRMPKVTSAFRAGPPEQDGEEEIALERQKLQAAVNASSVVSFVENLTPQQKEDVLLSTLFAQRAADAKTDPVADMEGWLGAYLDTLSLLGWSTQSAPQMKQNTLQGSASFDQAILNILATIATQNQFAILQSAFEGLKSLKDTSGQIKLFDLSSSVTSGGHFQVGAAEASGNVVSMALGAFHYEFADRQKNILFAQWGDTEFHYWMAAQRMTLSGALYADVRDQVTDKLSDARRKMIADIPLS